MQCTMECGWSKMVKYRKYPWPTDGATKKQLDRVEDKLIRKLTAIREAQSRMVIRIVELEALAKKLEEE